MLTRFSERISNTIDYIMLMMLHNNYTRFPLKLLTMATQERLRIFEEKYHAPIMEAAIPT